MTADELAAMIAEEIDNNSGTRAILAKVQRGDATLEDSERFTGITAEITGRLLADNVLSLPLSDRQGAFVDITAARYRDTFSVFSAVQRVLDERLGISLAVVDPGFEKARAQKAGHALADQTVPESTVVRRAESAGENIVRSQHDRIVQKQAEFRDRAGLQCSAIREGGAKCCEWCASVSGKYPASDTPQGFWGRHDNCKCSILYETRKGVQRLGGSAKKWEPLRDAGAPEPVRLTAEQASELEAKHQPKVLTNGVSHGILNTEEQQFLDRILADPDMSPAYRQILMDRFTQGSELAQKAFSKFIPPDSVSVKDSPEDYYTHATRVVMGYKRDETSWKRNGSTWFHEHGHMIDDLAGQLTLYHQEFYNVMKNDFARFITERAGTKRQLSYREALDYLYADSALRKKLSNEMKGDNTKLSSVSDTMEGISAAMIRGGIGHEEQYPGYWDDVTIPLEAFAHMFEAQFDREHYQIMQQYFPTALNVFETLLKEAIT